MPRKRRSSTRRTLAIAGVFAALAAAAVVAANLLNRDPRPILADADPAADLARRAAPENAFHILSPAVAALPEAPEPRVARDRNWRREWWPITWEAAAAGPAQLVDCGLPDTDPALAAHMESVRAALDAVRPALDRPYYLQAEAPVLTPWSRREPAARRFTRALVALGAYQARIQNDPAAGIATLRDAVRASRLFAQDRGFIPEDPGAESEALAQLRTIARSAPDAAVLDAIAATLDGLGAPYAAVEPLIVNQWRMLDNTLRQPRLTGDVNIGRRMGLRFLLWYWQEVADWIRPRQAELLAFTAKPPRELFAFLEAQDFRWRDEEKRWGPVYAMWRLLGNCRAVAAQYEGTRIVAALERHFRATGGYPPSLDALAPAYLAAVPSDPLSGAPFVYKPGGAGYALYSLGDDGADDNGDREKDRFLVGQP